MKKFLATIAAAILIAFAAPAFAVTNPFMDVPLNHWAYDAIGQLAARGILSGFPDGTYKGRQPSTRYEMASAIARTLAVVDMTKAGRQDVELLKRLVVEFKDELDALGVRVDQLDSRVGGLHRRLGGWQISGILRADVEGWRRDEERLRTNIFQARLFLDRWFGDNEDIRFHARLRNDSGTINGTHSIQLHRFWVEFPWFFDTRVTAGRFNMDWEWPYNFYTNGISDLGNWSLLTDWGAYDGLMLTRSFALGSFQMYASRAVGSPAPGNDPMDPWHIAAMTNLQFTEQIGVDLGIQHLRGDNATIYHYYDDDENWVGAFKFNRVTTLFGGLRFDFNPNIGFRGIYYHQRSSLEMADAGSQLNPAWVRDNYNTRAYKLVVDVKQDLLGFTSLWLGYDFMRAGFMTTGGGAGGFEHIDTVRRWGDYYTRLEYDMRTWRVGAIQQWNDQWRTWAYFAHHTFVDVPHCGSIWNPKGVQWGVGVEYMLNPNVGFALNYVRTRFDRATSVDDNPGTGWIENDRNNHLVRFRTQVTF